MNPSQVSDTTIKNWLVFRELNEELAKKNGVFFARFTDNLVNEHKTDPFAPLNATELMNWVSETRFYARMLGHRRIRFYKGKFVDSDNVRSLKCIDDVSRHTHGDWMSTGIYEEMTTINAEL